MEVEQDDESICLHLNTYIQETLEKFKSTIKKFFELKQVPMQPGAVLEHDDCPETPDPQVQIIFWSFSAKLQSAGGWARCDISFPASQLE